MNVDIVTGNLNKAKQKSTKIKFQCNRIFYKKTIEKIVINIRNYSLKQ